MLKVSTILALFAAVLLSFANCYLYDWPTGDERWHYAYSERMLKEGEIERETVHNFNSTTPFVLLNVFAQEIATTLGLVSGVDKVVTRVPAVGWYLLLLLLAPLSARYLFQAAGPEQATSIACWAALLTCLDQTLLGQGSHIGSDIPFAAMTLLFLMALEKYRRLPDFKAALLVAAVIGLSFNVKYSASFLLFFAVTSMTFIHVRYSRRTNSFSLRSVSALLCQFLAASILVSLIVDAAYGFQAIGQSFSSKEWYSAPFKFLAQLIPNLPLPWPLPFIAGFDHQFAAERTWQWNSILLGREYPNGTLLYFPLVWLLKTPLALIAVTLLGGVLALTRLGELRKNGAFLLTFLLFAFLLSYFCLIFRTQVGIRYTLMCLPLAYLLIGYVISTGLKLSEQSLLAVFLLFGTGYEAAPYLGNNLSFTNSIIADKSTAYAWIADSNIDWFHNYSRAQAAASRKLGKFVFNPPHILEGNNLFSINKLAGVMRNFPQYAWIREKLQPSGNFGGTLIWFNVDKKTFDRFLNEARSYAPPKGADSICPPGRIYKPLQNGLSIELGGSWKEPGLYTGCLKVTEPTEIELKVLHGHGAFGSYPAELNCVGDEAGGGESLWFKLSPGIHPICANIMDPAQAIWIIHQGKTEVAFRNQ